MSVSGQVTCRPVAAARRSGSQAGGRSGGVAPRAGEETLSLGSILRSGAGLCQLCSEDSSQQVIAKR